MFGVLSIIFSSVVLLGSALGLLGTLASSALAGAGNMVPDADKAAELNAMLAPMARVYQGLGLESLILFLMSVLLLAIGIGQLRYRAWARRWSVYWAVAGLACVVLLVVISWTRCLGSSRRTGSRCPSWARCPAWSAGSSPSSPSSFTRRTRR